MPSGDILCADKRVGRGRGWGGWYVAVEPPVPSYSGSGVEGIASIVQHSISMRAFYPGYLMSSVQIWFHKRRGLGSVLYWRKTSMQLQCRGVK